MTQVQTDWFTDNAPPPQAASGGDWFAENAPGGGKQASAQPGFLDKEIPLDSYSNATLQGVQSIGRGVRGAVEGIGNLIAHPIDTAKAMAQLPSQAAEAPAAISDINQSEDPTGTYAKVAQETAGQGAGQAVVGLATEGLGATAKAAARPILDAAGKTATRVSERMYQSALKPSTTLGSERVANIVRTGLDNSIPVTAEGADKLSGLIQDLSDKVKDQIQSGSRAGATIDPQAVAQRADQVKGRFATQVNPDADLAAIDSAKSEFLKNNPNQIPAADAQAMKQGTYAQLKGKAYGELRSATIESQKALARGIKEELEAQFPEIKGLNARQAQLINLDGALEKAVRRIDNHQLFGIGTPIATAAGGVITGSPVGAAAAGMMKLLLDNPEFKTKLAIALNHAGNGNIPIGEAISRVGSYSNALASALPKDTQAEPNP